MKTTYIRLVAALAVLTGAPACSVSITPLGSGGPHQMRRGPCTTGAPIVAISSGNQRRPTMSSGGAPMLSGQTRTVTCTHCGARIHDVPVNVSSVICPNPKCRAPVACAVSGSMGGYQPSVGYGSSCGYPTTGYSGGSCSSGYGYPSSGYSGYGSSGYGSSSGGVFDQNYVPSASLRGPGYYDNRKKANEVHPFR